MLAVVSCNKYAQQTLRIADVGARTQPEAQQLLDGLGAFECPICGPCSHVELSWRGRFKIHAMCECLDDARDKAKAIQAEDSDHYRLLE